MKLFSKINLRRILSIGLLSITLFLGSAFALSTNNLAIADVAKAIDKDEAVGISGDTMLDETEYESAKMSRNERQAARSQKAEDANTEDADSIVEILNLDQITETLGD